MAGRDATAAVRAGRYELLHRLVNSAYGERWLGCVVDGADAGRAVWVRRYQKAELGDELTDDVMSSALESMGIRGPRLLATLDMVDDPDAIAVAAEFVEGVSLGELLSAARRDKHPIPLDVAARIGVDTARCLEALREAGSDESIGGAVPDALFVTHFGETMALDAGLRAALPAFRDAAETAAYACPEQLAPTPHSDVRSDVFFVAVLVWEMLAGRSLFNPGGHTGKAKGRATASAVRYGAISKLSKLARPGFEPIPAALDDFIAKALTRDAKPRPQTLGEFCDGLEQAISPASSEKVGLLVERIAKSGLRELRDRVSSMTEAQTDGEGAAPDSKRPTHRPKAPTEPPPAILPTPPKPSVASPNADGAARDSMPSLTDEVEIIETPASSIPPAEPGGPPRPPRPPRPKTARPPAPSAVAARVSSVGSGGEPKVTPPVESDAPSRLGPSQESEATPAAVVADEEVAEAVVAATPDSPPAAKPDVDEPDPERTSAAPAELESDNLVPDVSAPSFPAIPAPPADLLEAVGEDPAQPVNTEPASQAAEVAPALTDDTPAPDLGVPNGEQDGAADARRTKMRKIVGAILGGSAALLLLALIIRGCSGNDESPHATIDRAARPRTSAAPHAQSASGPQPAAVTAPVASAPAPKNSAESAPAPSAAPPTETPSTPQTPKRVIRPPRKKKRFMPGGL